MAYFRDDNTEGYSAADLAILNERFETAITAEEPIADSIRDSHEKNVAARVQFDFDQAAR
jgi:hypothetical protein